MRFLHRITSIFLILSLIFSLSLSALAAVSPEEEVVEEEKKAPYELVPQYFQDDYPDEPYGNSTVAKGGCSVTSLAMVATYLTGHEYLPDELAYYFGGRAENNIARLEIGSDVLQLPYKRAENFRQVMKALEEGKVAIVLMNSTSIFTDTQHFIVLTGLNEEGRIMINDSYRSNYNKWDLKKALVNGFNEGSVLKGYSGGWIYDKSQMPDDPFIYSEHLPRFENRGAENENRERPRYSDIIELTPKEEDLMARAVCAEAGEESDACRQAVAEVILNRLLSADYPDDLESILADEKQFDSDWKQAKPKARDYEALERALAGPYQLVEGVIGFSETPVLKNTYGEIGGFVFIHDGKQ